MCVMHLPLSPQLPSWQVSRATDQQQACSPPGLVQPAEQHGGQPANGQLEEGQQCAALCLRKERGRRVAAEALRLVAARETLWQGLNQAMWQQPLHTVPEDMHHA